MTTTKYIKAILLGIILFSLPHSSMVEGQQTPPRWKVIVENFPDPDQIKSIDVSFRVETYVSPKVMQAARERYAKTYPTEASLPDDKITYPWILNPNGVLSYRVRAQGEQFRCDRTRVYPVTKTPIIDYIIYDGEKLYEFDGQFFHGHSTPLQKAGGFFQDYKSLNHLGWPSYIETFKKRKDWDFKFVKEENIDGNRCLVYASEPINETDRLIVSVCPEKGYAIQRLESYVLYKGEHRAKADGVAVIYSAEQFQNSGTGVYFPTTSRIESYDIIGNKLNWHQTTRCNFSNVKFNSKIPQGAFDRYFPPGTLVMDEIDSPGASQVEGGRILEAIDSVQRGAVPPLTIPDGTVVPTLQNK